MKSNKNSQLQQGDVLLSPIAKVPANAKPIAKDKRGVVLAEGEITGHYHGIDEDEGSVALLTAPDGARFVVNSGKKAATLRHQEHKPVTIPPGSFRLGIVREKDWFQDMVRAVVD